MRKRTLIAAWGLGVGGGLVALVTSLGVAAPADETPRQDKNSPSYNRDIRPILADHCFSCHGTDEKNRKGALRLDERDAALVGGESGEPAIVPGKPEQSALLRRVTAHDDRQVMPPPRVKNPLG